MNPDLPMIRENSCDASFQTTPHDASQNFEHAPQLIDPKEFRLPPKTHTHSRNLRHKPADGGPITKGYIRFPTKYGMACAEPTLRKWPLVRKPLCAQKATQASMPVPLARRTHTR